MPYEPNSWGRTERERNFKLVWLGGIGSVLALAVYLWNPAFRFSGILAPLVGFSAGSVMASVFGQKQDDFFLALCAQGLQWMGCFVALHMLIVWILRPFDGRSSWISAILSPLSDAFLVSLTAIVVFHLGYAVAWLRNRS